jgi:hypothetical protein
VTTLASDPLRVLDALYDDDETEPTIEVPRRAWMATRSEMEAVRGDADALLSAAWREHWATIRNERENEAARGRQPSRPNFLDWSRDQLLAGIAVLLGRGVRLAFRKQTRALSDLSSDELRSILDHAALSGEIP